LVLTIEELGGIEHVRGFAEHELVLVLEAEPMKKTINDVKEV
jgi:hypothetical protein